MAGNYKGQQAYPNKPQGPAYPHGQPPIQGAYGQPPPPQGAYGQPPPPQGAYGQPPPPHGTYVQPPVPHHGQPNYAYTSAAGHQPAYVQAVPVAQTVPSPPDYMAFAIITCLCCFCPTGIFAIVKAKETQDANARGDYASARESSKLAKTLSIVSLVIGLVWIIAIIVVYAVGAVAFTSNYNSYVG